MGCGPSALAVAELNRSIATETGGQRLLGKLQSFPGLLSTLAPVLSCTAGTPLHAACEKRQVLVVQDIIAFLISSPLPQVRAALQPFCRRLGRELPASVGEGLLLAIDMVNWKGQTPLMMACASGSPHIVKLLLAHGADPWVGDFTAGRCALHYAALAGHADCIEALLQNLRPQDMARQGFSYVNVRTQSGLSALHFAVFFDRQAAVEELLRHDPNINATTTANTQGEEALLAAAACDALSTPLHFAAHRGNIEVARLLLRHYLVHMPAWGTNRNQDPRIRSNYGNLLPWQVAAFNHPGKRDLAALLHPGEPLERALGLPLGLSRDGQLVVALGRRGPLPLANLAAAALQAKLLADLQAIKAAPRLPCDRPSGGGGKERDAVTHGPVSGMISAAGSRGQGQGRSGGPLRFPLLMGAPRCSNRSGSLASGPNSDFCGRSDCSFKPLLTSNSSGLESSASGGVSSQAYEGGAGADEADADEDERLCNVCFSNRQEVAAAGCGHAVCGQCAEELCRGMVAVGRPRPLPCAFCRRAVQGFVRVAIPEPAC